MPQIFRYLKFIFSFLSNEHLPPHVHVSDENDNQSMNSAKVIRLINATWLGDYKIELHFDDNVVRQVDFGKFLYNNPHPQHDKYRKLSNFRKFKIERNNLVWGKNWDLEFDLWKLYQGVNP